jgi:hypothetical protein
MITIKLEKTEQDLLVEELEHCTIPGLRELIASGSMRKKNRDELKKDEFVLKTLLEKLKMAA